MLSIFDPLRELTALSVALRMGLALLCGGAIGIEREFKRRAAGFRTHILICLGAAMTTLTSQYLLLYMNYYTDLSRLGAQVVAGIGFIGAGTIMVTRRQRVKGLTTAAGLWASAIIGLAIGAGFYEAAVFSTLLILAAELVFSKLDRRVQRHLPIVNLYLEYRDRKSLDQILAFFRDCNIRVLSMQVTRAATHEKHNAMALFTLRLHRGISEEELMRDMRQIPGVVSIQEL